MSTRQKPSVAVSREAPPQKKLRVSLSPARSSFASSLTIRLTNELKRLTTAALDELVDVAMVDESIFVWKVSLKIDEQPFSDAVIELFLRFGSDYPFVSPSVIFVNHMFHPNVDENSNQLCTDGKWNAVYDVSAFIVTICALLRFPSVDNGSTPANCSAFIMLNESYEHYVQYARSLIGKRFCTSETLTQSSQDVSDAIILQNLVDPILRPDLFSHIVDDKAWQCENCTLINPSSSDRCEACDVEFSPKANNGDVNSSSAQSAQSASSAQSAQKQEQKQEQEQERRGGNSGAKLAPSVKGDTKLHVATRNDREDDVRSILSTFNGLSKINVRNSNSNTALHIACNLGHVQIAAVLLSYGADTSFKNRYGLTPKECAIKKKHTKVQALFG